MLNGKPSLARLRRLIFHGLFDLFGLFRRGFGRVGGGEDRLVVEVQHVSGMHRRGNLAQAHRGDVRLIVLGVEGSRQKVDRAGDAGVFEGAAGVDGMSHSNMQAVLATALA